MREIKFRGKGTNGVWHEGLLGRYVISRGGKYEYGEWCIENLGDCFPVQEDTIGQFTGLTDKNGREIYEGDVITHGCDTIRYVVEWHDSGLLAKQLGSSSWAGVSYWQDRTEVIGNIHDNPELLKQEVTHV